MRYEYLMFKGVLGDGEDAVNVRASEGWRVHTFQHLAEGRVCILFERPKGTTLLQRRG